MLIESDFGGPMVWYFNDVWGAGLVLTGGDEGPPWYVIVAYAVLGVAFLGAMTLPFWKVWRRKQSLWDRTSSLEPGAAAPSAFGGTEI